LLGWLVVGLFLQWLAPSWESVAKDGDFAFMPASMPSLKGQAWLDAGFPENRAKSQIAIVLARPEAELQEADLAVGLDLGRKLHHQLAEVCWKEASKIQSLPTRQRLLEQALDSLNQAIDLDEQLAGLLVRFGENAPIRKNLDRLAILYWDRGQLARLLGDYRMKRLRRSSIPAFVKRTPLISATRVPCKHWWGCGRGTIRCWVAS
jgi:hypothetical protein